MARVYLRHYPDEEYPRWSSLIQVEAVSLSEFKIGDSLMVKDSRPGYKFDSFPSKKIFVKVVGVHDGGFIVEEVSREEKIDLIVNGN